MPKNDMECETPVGNLTEPPSPCGNCGPCLESKIIELEITVGGLNLELIAAKDEAAKYQKAAIHFEEKAAGLQGTIDRLKEVFRSILEAKP